MSSSSQRFPQAFALCTNAHSPRANTHAATVYERSVQLVLNICAAPQSAHLPPWHLHLPAQSKFDTCAAGFAPYVINSKSHAARYDSVSFGSQIVNMATSINDDRDGGASVLKG
jgi:hypothetical protein